MATDDAQGLVKPSGNNNNKTEQQNKTKASEIKENKKQPETIFDKIFIRFCLYVIPALLFIALPGLTNTTSLLSSSASVNYIACYGLYIVLIELVRKLHSDSAVSTRARNVFNQSFVYVPLSLFLFTASYALYSAGSEVFGVQPAEQRQAFVQDIGKFLTTYKAQCNQASASTKEQHQCIENYLNATVFADVKLLQEKYGDASNSYSIIAIMTGFFGVLMTVLVIYFSLSGREMLEQKLAASDRLKEDLELTKEEFENVLRTSNSALQTAKIVSKKVMSASKTAAEASKIAESTAATAAEALTIAAEASKIALQLSAPLKKLQLDVQALQELKDKGQQNRDESRNNPNGNSNTNLGTSQAIDTPIKTFDKNLNVTHGELFTKDSKYRLTFYRSKTDHESKRDFIEEISLTYPFNQHAGNFKTDSFNTETVLIISPILDAKELQGVEETFYYKPSNSPQIYEKNETANENNKIQATNSP